MWHSMARRGGWSRTGSRGRFRYFDSHRDRIADPDQLARIEALAIPPAWRDVWISPRPGAKLQATGVDAAGRRQYLYHEEFREAQERAKYEKLIRFGERLPDLREAMADHLELERLDPDRVSAVATRLINLGWFRVGSDRAAKHSRTFGITTLRKRHVAVRGQRIAFSFRGKARAQVRRTLVDEELADEVRYLLGLNGGTRLFRYRLNGGLRNLTAERLNDYIGLHMGDDFTAKDFRTWGGTLLAAVALAEHGPADTETERKRIIAAVMRAVGEKLGNTPAVCRASYVSPAVVEQYLEGRTLDDFRPRHLRVVGARDIGLDPEEASLLSLLRSWRIREARVAA
jgi:DNA topoisomerase-1